MSPLLKGKSAVVNAQQPGEGQVAYCAAKAGVEVQSDEIADAALYLASNQARLINGHTLVIDGGSLTRGCSALLSGR
ncbi:MAG: SDR family oxidoreductase [Chloroflexi bacterium]|nr:SDR family oxidoreductase [Chloroflexota bacterium]